MEPAAKPQQKDSIQLYTATYKHQQQKKCFVWTAFGSILSLIGCGLLLFYFLNLRTKVDELVAEQLEDEPAIVHIRRLARKSKLWDAIFLNVTRQVETLKNKIEPPHDPIVCKEPYVRNPFSNTCIGLGNSEKNWHNAKLSCTLFGGDLVVLETLESASWFLNLRRTKPEWGEFTAWIGGHKRDDNSWYWVGRVRMPLQYSLWFHSEPNHPDLKDYCLSSYHHDDVKHNGEFSDDACSEKHKYFCEKTF